jgi:hypothetical protein
MKSKHSVMSSDLNLQSPTIRVIHHMARTGGTIICRCLASMNNIILLSEIHPAGMKVFNPMVQAHKWYGLLTPDDVVLARSGKLDFKSSIRLISDRCQEQNKLLFIRDWSHLDYTGVPFVKPEFSSLLVRELKADFDLVRFSTVRHPLDQWLSLSKKPVFQNSGPEKFLVGASRFADSAKKTGFIRYEDFTRDCDEGLRTLCKALQVKFDPGYRQKWPQYTNITGDVSPGRSGDVIRPQARQKHDPGEAEKFSKLLHYQQTIKTLGYDA